MQRWQARNPAELASAARRAAAAADAAEDAGGKNGIEEASGLVAADQLFPGGVLIDLELLCELWRGGHRSIMIRMPEKYTPILARNSDQWKFADGVMDSRWIFAFISKCRER